MYRQAAERLIVRPSDGVEVSYEYDRGATTLVGLSGEFAGLLFPVYDKNLANSRSQGNAPGSPEGIMHAFRARRTAVAAADEAARITAARTGTKVEYPADPTRASDYRKICMLGSLIIRRPSATANELATEVLERFVYPQQDALARDVAPEIMGDIIDTATAGQQLYDQLTAATQ